MEEISCSICVVLSEATSGLIPSQNRQKLKNMLVATTHSRSWFTKVIRSFPKVEGRYKYLVAMLKQDAPLPMNFGSS